MNFGFSIKIKWTFCVLLLLFDEGSSEVSYNDVRSDFETLLSAYQSTAGGVDVTDVMPKDLSSGPVVVYMGISLFAIMDYDAVSGVVQLVASMKMEWLDEVKTLTGTTFMGSLDTIFVGYDQIWSPDLVLMSSVDSIERIGDESYKIRYNVSSGYCKWYPRMIINAACTPDMTYYPFDKQSCTLTVTPWNRGITDLRLEPLTNEWNLANMEKSATWGIDTTSTETYIGRNNTRYFVDFKITIKRKPLFLALVIVLPVLLLSFLTGFLFLLPAASGSRVGFGITCFLSFIVLLQTIMSFMPEVSSPMSILCFYVILMLSFCVFLSIANVFLLRLHLNPSKDEVPQYFQIILEVITCKVWRRCPKCPKIRCQFLRDCWHRLPTCTRFKFWKKHHPVDYRDDHMMDDTEMERVTRRNSVLGSRLSVIGEASALRNRFTPEHETGLIRTDNEDIEGLETMYDVNKVATIKGRGKRNTWFVGSSGLDDRDDVDLISQPLRSKSFRNSVNDINGTIGILSVHSSGYMSANFSDKSSSSDPHVGSGSNQSADEFPGPSHLVSDCHSSPGSRVQSALTSASTPPPKTELTWEYIAGVLDLFFLVLFVIVQIIFTVFFLVPLGAQY